MDDAKKLQVAGLVNFPFSEFQDFVDAYNKKQITTSINTVTIYDLATLKSKLPRKIWVMTAPIPYIAIIVYTIISRSWLFLLSLFVVIIVTLLFHPSGRKILKPLNIILKPFSYLGLIYFIITNNPPLIVLASCIIFIHLWWEISLAASRKLVDEILLEDQDVLCRVWLNQKMFISESNGKIHFPSETYNL